MNFKDFFSPDNMTVLGTNLAIIVATIVAGFKAFNKKWDELREKGSHDIKGQLIKQSQIDMRIMKKLEETKEFLNADRIQIYDFHNGMRYASGRSALKMTCTYEGCRYGIKSYQPSLSAIPLNCMPNYISKILNDGEIECKDIETMKDECPASYAHKIDMQVKSFYDIAIHNNSGEPVGFVEIQFCKNKYNVNKEVVQKLVWFVETELADLMK